MKWSITGSTISGANGNEATTAHGASVPSGHASSYVVIELAHDTIHIDGVGPSAIAGGNAPATSTIAGKFEWIVDGILLLHVGRPSAVLKVINAFTTHECIQNTPEVNPDMRELVRE